MRKIIVTEWISLDGFIAGPDNNLDFVTSMYDDEMGKYEGDVIANVDTLILGRTTYDSFAGAWPKVPDNPSVSNDEKAYARRLNKMNKIVFSRTLDTAEWNNSRLYHSIDPDEMRRLKQQPGQDMLIYGSASIVSAFTQLGLIDEYQLLYHPVILGQGKALFAGMQRPAKLVLKNTKAFRSGVVLFYYGPG